VKTFEEMKATFEGLAKHYRVLPPIVAPALPTDPCDLTDPPYVRINLRQKCDRDYQVRHLFGHYLADLHAVEEGSRYSDDVADVIAQMVEESRPFRKSSRVVSIFLAMLSRLWDNAPRSERGNSLRAS
jgi:hypothetical protein